MDEFVKYKSKYKRRLSIKPGITGMWQASGRSDITDFDEVLALDLEYKYIIRSYVLYCCFFILGAIWNALANECFI